MRNLTIALFALVLLMPLVTIATSNPNAAALADKNTLQHHTGAPLLFMENAGQVIDQHRKPRTDIQFSLHASAGLNVFLGNGVLHYQFSRASTTGNIQNGKLILLGDKQERREDSASFYRMDVELVGANRNARVIAGNPAEYHVNYFNEHTNGRSVTAHSFASIVYQDVYPGIDWVLFVDNGKLKHEFRLKRGANPDDIRLRYHGTTGLKVAQDGRLVASTPMGVITENAPVSFQADGTKVPTAFSLVGNELTYLLGDYKGDLTIDPGLAWSTYLGGDMDDIVFCVAIDNAENVFASGQTHSFSSIATTGAYSATIGGYEDAFLAKFNSAGALQWSTYYGGSSDEWSRTLAVDATGSPYIAGHTWSTSGIATPGAHQTVWAGASASWGDAFLAKFNATGSIAWSTYFGGAADDVAAGLTVTGTGDILMAGGTMSPLGIATAGADITTSDAAHRTFVTKFTATGVQVWGTYCTGVAAAVACDAVGNIYVAGSGDAIGGAGTPGTHQPAFGGGWADGFLVRLNSAGFHQWATFYGGELLDNANSVAVDDSGYIYLAGTTVSDTGIATPGSYKYMRDTPDNDAFVAKFDSSGSRIWGTYFGGTAWDNFTAVATDHKGYIWLAGSTLSSTGIATPDGYRTTIGDTGVSAEGDMMLIKMNEAGSLVWSTYYGGQAYDYADAVAVSDTTVVIGGRTNSLTGIATPGASDMSYSGTSSLFVDGAITIFSNCVPFAPASVSGADTVCVGSSITLSASATGGTWSSASASVASVADGTVTGISAGTSAISYTRTNLCGVAATSKTISVIDCSLQVGDLPGSGIHIYPNPIINAITVNAPQPLGAVTIVDMLGRQVFGESFLSKSTEISMKALPPGLYILQLQGQAFKVTKI